MFFPISPPWQVCLVVQSHAFVSVYVLGGVVQRQEFVPLLGRFQMASCPFEAWGFFDSKPGRNVPLWIQKWKGNILQNTRLQRNGRQSPKSYYGMSDSCVKTRSIGLQTYTSKLNSTAKMYVSPTMTNGFEMCGVLNASDGLWGLSRLLDAKW